jgi:glutamate synthase domain-containing protein 2
MKGLSMKTANKQWMIAGLLAAIAMAAGAQTPAPSAQAAQAPGRMMAHEHHGNADPARMQQRMARMQARMAKHLAAFKQKLQLSPAQEGAWNSYIAALKPSGTLQHHDRAEFARLPTPERIDRMRALRAERMAEMDRRGDAAKTFYAALSPQQQKTFDEATARRGARHHDGRGGHHHRPHHRG